MVTQILIASSSELNLICYNQHRDIVYDIPPLFLQTSDETQEETVQLETEIEYESGMLVWYMHFPIILWLSYYFPGATSESVNQSEKQSQLQPSPAPHTSPDITADLIVLGKYILWWS